MYIYSKSADNQLIQTRTEEIVITYDVKFLNSQKTKLEADLAEVNNLLSEAEKLGIKDETDITGPIE